MRPFVVGIAGGTASGKTTIAEAFARSQGAALIAQDRYYRTFPDPHGVNFDHPDSLETSLLVAHLDELRQGRSVAVPRYHFPTHSRLPEVDVVLASPLVVVEGILVLAEASLRARLDLCVYVEVPDDVRLLRRALRDTRERGRSLEGVAEQYLASVRPMHEAFVRPSAAYAGLVLDGMAPTAGEVRRLADALPRA